MADPKQQLKDLLAKAAARQPQAQAQNESKEPEMVEVTQFISPEGKVYWAKKAKTPNCVERHLVKKQVVKGSAEDQ